MLTLALALLVLGAIGLVLAAVRRVWPAAMPWRRILLVELLVLAAWTVGGNVLATLREGRAERAWMALDPNAAAPAPTAGSGPNAAALELVKLASGMGIHVGRDADAAAAASEPALQAAMATLGSVADGAFRQADDRLTPATAELRAWLVLQDEKLRAVQKHLLDGGPIDWGAPREDDRLSYSSLEILKLNAALVASALDRMRTGDPGGASTALEAASRLAASLRDRPDTVSRMWALAQDRRLLGALRVLDPVPAGFERPLDEIEQHTRPLGAHSRESLELMAEARKPYTTLRGLILERDTESMLLEHRRPLLPRLWLTLSGGLVSVEGWGDALAAERRRTTTPFYRFVQGPLEKPGIRLLVADHVAVQAREAAAAKGADPCRDLPGATPAAVPGSPDEGSFVASLARRTAVTRVELELTRVVQRARFLRALSPKREWPAELGSVDSRVCTGRRFVARFEGDAAEVRLEPNPFGEKEATVSFRMTGR